MAKTDRKYLSDKQRDRRKNIMEFNNPTIKHPRNKYLGTDTPYRYQKPRGVNMPDEPTPKAKELLKKGKPVYFL